ncbi:hypothetical protein WDJ51_01955 [Rathayibacter sp. YIM 133350]|uniref:hypothetical protein n=1 Tax=Rathayibacter sp. YIM 133350 TaxID=3131992 RepID=UPI00307E8242
MPQTLLSGVMLPLHYLERSQRPGTFVVSEISVEGAGVRVVDVASREHDFPVDIDAGELFEALAPSVPRLSPPRSADEISRGPGLWEVDVWSSWTMLHYALCIAESRLREFDPPVAIVSVRRYQERAMILLTDETRMGVYTQPLNTTAIDTGFDAGFAFMTRSSEVTWV